MGESSACLMRSFSQPSPTSRDYDNGDPLRALTTSICFGRFMTDTLDWEKRSAFTQNRHLEEAKKLSKIGSVAQKKAYFEAHYKRIAAKKKAAALLEQEAEAANLSPTLSVRVDSCNDSPINLEFVKPNSSDLVPIIDANIYKPSVEANELYASSVEETEPIKGQVAYIEKPIQVELLNQREIIDNSKKMTEEEKAPIKVKDVAKKRDFASLSKKKPLISSSKSSTYTLASKPRVPVNVTTVHSRKDDNADPNCNKTARESLEKKRSNPKSLHMSINFGSRAGETVKKSSPILNKIGNSRIVKTFVKASNDSWIQRTPTRVSVNGVPKHTLVKPQPEKRRTETLLYCPVSGRKAADGKSPSLSKDLSEYSRACATKMRSPIVSSSFSFKSEERAAKRKEFFRKLEENAKEAEKVRLQAKSKNVFVLQIPPTRPCSPRLGRKSTLSINQDTSSRSPWKSSLKSDGSKNVAEKNKRTTIHSVNLPPKKNMRENASPNIPF
ncbi:hypothetical protein LguiA_000140 [Lonicera macranthoides]